MDVLLIAGGIPGPEDRLYEYAQGKPKALIDVAGKPMVQWVLDAVSQAKHTGRVALVGLDEHCGLTCDRPMDFLPDQGGMLDNAMAGMQRLQEVNPAAELALLLPGDIPAIKPQMVDWRIESAKGSKADIDYTVIERSVMEGSYPESKRSYTRLKDVEVCGGDAHILRLSLAADRSLWDRLVAARKSIFKQAALIGLDTLFLLLTRSMTLEGAVKLVGKRLGISAAATLSPYAEVGMDADKPFQVDILREELGSAGSKA
jgi:GTP:adenosylcobinamide-phosphate guanylyltransferase